MSVPRLRPPRAPFSRPNTAATGRPERPDPCADPPTVTITATRVMPVLPDGTGAGPEEAAAAAVTVPRLPSVTPAGRVWSSARLHPVVTLPVLLAVVGAVVAVALAGGPVADPSHLAAVLRPVVIAYVVVQVACAGAVLARPAHRRARSGTAPPSDGQEVP